MDELLEKYLSLKESERGAFEKTLTSEQRAALARELGIMEGLNEGFKEELRSKVSAFELKSVRAKKMNPAFVGIAASFLLISFFTVYLLRDKESLFDQYYQTYENFEVTVSRGVSEDNKTVIEKAFGYYDTGNYSKAIELFQRVSQDHEKYSAVLFFRGIANMEINQYSKALMLFQKVGQNNDPDYTDAARWYQSLANLKLENITDAQIILRELASESGEYQSKAQNLLQDL